uniref:Uncharacterized protein n=1 Tax=Cladonia uncialis subsp. uncialis TaxID=180999 RepID=A0A2K9YE88_CLAUC|nr:hypothetical protein [Cladonia uncialis subsp. uncialis]
MRSEILLPELFPNKRPREPINPNQRVLYGISEPMTDIYGEEERVRSSSRSSAGTLQGDNMNKGSESPRRDDNRSLDWRNDASPLLTRDGIQPCARESASTPLSDDRNGWNPDRDHDALKGGLAKPRAAQSLDHDRSSTQRSSSPEYMMSGALAEGDPSTSTIPMPLDFYVHDKVTSGPDCLCKSVPTGTEKDQKALTEIAWSRSILLLMLVIRVVLNLCNVQPNVHGRTVHIGSSRGNSPLLKASKGLSSHTMALPIIPSDWTAQTSNVEIAEWLVKLREAALPELAIYSSMIAFTDSRQKQRYLDSIPPNEIDEIEGYKACTTISGAVRCITKQSAALVESNYNNAAQDNAGEAYWHAVGLARVEQQYYIYNSTFDPAKYKDEAPPRIRTLHGCSNIVNLLDVIRSPKTVSIPAVKNAQGKAVKGLGKTIANVWMTGIGSSKLDCRTEAALFLSNVASGQAGISAAQPEAQNAAGYHWVKLAW